MSERVPGIPAPTTALRFSTVVLALSSGAFAAATVLDLTEATGALRVAAIALAALGFVALLAATFGGSLIALRRVHFFRKTAAETYLPIEVNHFDPHDPDRTSTQDDVAEPQEEAFAAVIQPPEQQAGQPVNSVSWSAAVKAQHLVWRYAGPHDLSRIARAGKDAIGEEFFYDASELAAYLAAQRDAVRCLVDPREPDASRSLRGYALLLALKPITVERIKAGRIARGRDILPNDLAQSLAETDAVYIGMLHGFDRVAQVGVVRQVVQGLNAADEKRRPQLVLAREGTSDGGLLMREVKFSVFGSAPYIKAAFTDGASFRREARKRLTSQPLSGERPTWQGSEPLVLEPA